jgi:hypothetical protein
MYVHSLDDRQNLISEELPSTEIGWDFEPSSDVEGLEPVLPRDVILPSDAIASDNLVQLSNSAPPSMKQALRPRLR